MFPYNPDCMDCTALHRAVALRSNSTPPSPPLHSSSRWGIACVQWNCTVQCYAVHAVPPRWPPEKVGPREILFKILTACNTVEIPAERYLRGGVCVHVPRLDGLNVGG